MDQPRRNATFNDSGNKNGRKGLLTSWQPPAQPASTARESSQPASTARALSRLPVRFDSKSTQPPPGLLRQQEHPASFDRKSGRLPLGELHPFALQRTSFGYGKKRAWKIHERRLWHKPSHFVRLWQPDSCEPKYLTWSFADTERVGALDVEKRRAIAGVCVI